MIHCVQNYMVFRIHKEIVISKENKINPLAHFKYWSILLRKKAINSITQILIEYYVIKTVQTFQISIEPLKKLKYVRS